MFDPPALPLSGDLPYRVVRRVLAGVPCLLELPPEGEALRAICLVFHGAWASKEGKLGVYSALVARGMAVVIPDAPLHGERQWEAPPGHNAREYVWDSVRRSVAELPGVLDELQAELGKLPVWVVGSSMGGYVAFTLARREKQIQKAAALITTGIWREPEVRKPEVVTFLDENRPVTHAADFLPVPLLLASGEADPVFPLAQHHAPTAATLREAYAQAGAEHLFHEATFPGVEHYTSRRMQGAVVRFLLAE